MQKLFKWFETRINPFPHSIEAIPNSNFFAFIKNSLKGIWKWFILAALFSLLIGVYEAYLFNILNQIVNWFETETSQTFWAHKKFDFFIIIGILVLGFIVEFLYSLVRFQTIYGAFPMRIRWRIHNLMLDQSFAFYQNEFSGRITTKLMQTSMSVKDLIGSCIDVFIYLLSFFVATFIIIISFNVWLVVPFIIWMFFYSLIIWYFVPRLGKLSEIQSDSRSLMSGRITDAYSNITTVKLFSHTKQEAGYTKQAMDELLININNQMRVNTKLQLCNSANIVLLIINVIVLCLFLWQENIIAVGAVAAAIAVAIRLIGFSHWVMWEVVRIFENIGIVQDGLNTFSKRQSVKDVANAKELKVTAGAIKFEHISFSYNDSKNILSDFNLDIKPGEKIGIVGRSGAGKTTLVNLLLRFFDVDKGRILIDGQDISQVTQNSLRRQLAMVTQDTSLLHRTIKENILYGNPTATEEEMTLAAQKASADEFINELQDGNGNQGYNVKVGERGVKLSGGQRQRIAIARVILKNAPILLLDEATSALDSEVEAAIQDNLAVLMHDKTVIAIAHRLSTIAAMDRLIVFERGQIIENGTHEELISQQGLYAKLWAKQKGGFIDTDE